MSVPAGLTSEEAEARRQRFGANEIVVRRSRPAILDLLARFASPLVLVLLAASAIAGALGDPKSFVIIACVVATSIALDFVQERRAQGAAEKLRAQVETRVSVMRDGALREISAREIVPGDVVRLAAGDLIPADARVVEAHALQVQQAALTGEPYPVDKSATPSEARADAGPFDATDAVFAGSAVVAGDATAVVTSTGRATELAKTAHVLSQPPPPHAFERGTRQFGALIVRLTILLVLFVLTVHALSGRRFLESLLFALALAVGLTPELLPMIVSVTLARGALRMAEAGVIVKRLTAIHDLGGMDVLCTDKTGTLTEARIVVACAIGADGRDDPSVLVPARAAAVLGGGVRSAIDESLAKRTDVDVARFRLVDELPFDPVTRRGAVLVDDGGRRTLIVKGAADELVEACELDPEPRAAIRARIERMAQDGLRVIAVATRDMDAAVERVEVHDVRALRLAGLVGFVDPPKKDAAGALERLRGRGVAVKIVTGDHELVARHVARHLSLEVRGASSGREIDRLDDDALAVRAEEVDLFYRVSPIQKNRVIVALGLRGHVVGYLGDGINDGPPLHSADVGISVDGAVDVAKEAADLILCRPDLSVLADGVDEGRRTLANVTKYVLMATSSNFGNMVSMAAASLFLSFLPMLPVQILLNNLLYDVSELAIPLDDVDDDALARPHRWDVGLIRRFMLMVGPISSVFDLLTFWILLRVVHADPSHFQTGWFVESIASQVFVIFAIRTRRSAAKSRPNRWLVVAALGAVAVAVVLPFTPAGAWVALVPLRATTLGLLAAIVVVYLAVVESVKRRAFARVG